MDNQIDAAIASSGAHSGSPEDPRPQRSADESGIISNITCYVTAITPVCGACRQHSMTDACIKGAGLLRNGIKSIAVVVDARELYEIYNSGTSAGFQTLGSLLAGNLTLLCMYWALGPIANRQNPQPAAQAEGFNV